MVTLKEPETRHQNVEPQRGPSQGNGLALAVLAVSQLMIILDATVVNVALPTIQRQLNFSPVNLEWLVNGYSIAFGGLLLLGGRAGDLFGRRFMFTLGISIFALASLLGGLAQNEIWLIIARIIQGAGGAIVAPTVLSLLTETFAEGASRNRAFGIYGAIGGAGGSLGLLLGGILTDLASWRWVFFINIIIGIAVLVIIPRAFAASRRRTGNLDLAGGLTVTLGMMSLVYGLSRAGNNTFSDRLVIVFLVLAAILFAAFVIIETRSRQPLMPWRIFSNRNRSGAYATALAVGAALFSVFFFLTLFVQNIRGYSPLRAGIAYLPLSISITVMSVVMSRLISKTGPRLPMAIGALISAGGLVWFAQLTPSSGYIGSILGPSIILGIGLGLLFLPMSLTAVSAVLPQQTGLASALLNAGQQIGGSLGLAILVNVAVSVTKAQVITGVAQVQAVTAGYSRAFIVAAGFYFLAFLIAALTIRNPRFNATHTPE